MHDDRKVIAMFYMELSPFCTPTFLHFLILRADKKSLGVRKQPVVKLALMTDPRERRVALSVKKADFQNTYRNVFNGVTCVLYP